MVCFLLILRRNNTHLDRKIVCGISPYLELHNDISRAERKTVVSHIRKILQEKQKIAFLVTFLFFLKFYNTTRHDISLSYTSKILCVEIKFILDDIKEFLTYDSLTSETS